MVHLPQTKGVLMGNMYWLSEAQMERLRPYSSKSQKRTLSVLSVVRVGEGRGCKQKSEFDPMHSRRHDALSHS